MRDLLAMRVVAEVRRQHPPQVSEGRSQGLLEGRQRAGHHGALAHHAGGVLIPVAA